MNRIEGLIERAKQAAAHDDFGADGWQEGLERLVHSATREAHHTQMGAAVFDGMVVDLLKQRLEVEGWFARHPEIDDEQIVAPLIGLGLPRTGSTAFSCMLGEDPFVRTLRTWEPMQLCPPPEKATYDADPRIALAEASMKVRDERFPRAKQMLPSTATSPTECQLIMGMDFKAQIFQAMHQVKSYVHWLHFEADLKSTYRWVKRVLKLLQWRCPSDLGPHTRWRLKNPSHILWIDDLNAVFPDARFWMTHRDPADVVTSVADLYFEYTKPFADTVDKAWLGAVNIEFCELGMNRVIAFRDKGNDSRFFDVKFAEFQADPWPGITALYAWMGEELTPPAREGMARWRVETPRDKHGSRSVDPADYGLEKEALRARFAFYRERFGI
ncbi:MAG: sulfotransferase family protein [Novosphingobium sp.]